MQIYINEMMMRSALF